MNCTLSCTKLRLRGEELLNPGLSTINSGYSPILFFGIIMSRESCVILMVLFDVVMNSFKITSDSIQPYS